MKDIAIYGAGGFGREVACLIQMINKEKNKWNFIGFFDDGISIDSENEYGKVIGGIDELNCYEGDLSIVFAIGLPKTVNSILSKIKKDDLSYPNLIATNVVYLDESSLSIGKGNIICSGCLISCNVKIGDFNILNSNVGIGHDTIIGDINALMPSVKISGGVEIGNMNFFGVSSVVLQLLKIKNHVTLGANSVLIRKPKENNTYVGNPARLIKY